MGKSNFSEQFRKLINRYKRIGYSLDIIRLTACLVDNPIIVDGYASLFNCTTAGSGLRLNDGLFVKTPVVYSIDRSKAVVPELVLLFVALWFILRGDLFYVLPCVILFLCFFSPFSITITSLGEERANLSAFLTFVRFVLVWVCLFPLPLGVWEGLRFVIVAFPGLFSYPFLTNGLGLDDMSLAWPAVVQLLVFKLLWHTVEFAVSTRLSLSQ